MRSKFQRETREVEVIPVRCPRCSNNEDRVVETREIADGSVIRRRRECEVCGSRYTTYERPAPQQVVVVKRDGRAEPFMREKLIRGVEKACANRPVSTDVILSIVQEIEDEVLSRNSAEVTSAHLGEAVLSKLLELDSVAYLRFASVYKRFGDPSDFSEELEKLKKRRRTARASTASQQHG